MDKTVHKNELIICGHTATKGAADILNKKRDELEKRFSYAYLFNAQEQLQTDSANETASGREEYKDAVCFTATPGESVFGLLYRIAETYGSGIEADLMKLPIRQCTIELFEYVDENPYLADSEGLCIYVSDDPVKVIEVTGGRRIGHLRDDNDKIVKNGEEKRFLTP